MKGGISKRKRRIYLLCVLSSLFLLFLFFCLIEKDYLLRPLFQSEAKFDDISFAGLEPDGRLYVIDKGATHLQCLDEDNGKMYYEITNTDLYSGERRFYDLAAAPDKTLYLYTVEDSPDSYKTLFMEINAFDSRGVFKKTIYSERYESEEDETLEDTPHTFPQYNSLSFRDGILYFARTLSGRVILYAYDSSAETLAQREYTFAGFTNYAVASLDIKDFGNFIYTTRDGNIYEIKDGDYSSPRLRASFDFVLGRGGITPWYLKYGRDDSIVFLDMQSFLLYRVSKEGAVSPLFEESYFTSYKEARFPVLSDFSINIREYAGAWEDSVWVFNGSRLQFLDYAKLPCFDVFLTVLTQVSAVITFALLVSVLYLLFKVLASRFKLFLLKQVIILIPALVIAVIFTYNFMFSYFDETVENEIKESALYMAVQSALVVDAGALESITSIKDFAGSAALEMRETLIKIVHNNSNEWNKSFSSSIDKIDPEKGAAYWLMWSNDEVNMFRPFSYFLKDKNDPLYKVSVEGTPVVFIYKYAGSNWCAAFAPIYGKSVNGKKEIAGLFEISFDIEKYKTPFLKQKEGLSLLAAYLCAVMIALSVFSVTFIVKKLKLMSFAINDMIAGAYSTRMTNYAKDELGKIAEGFNDMAGKLETQVKEINEQIKHISETNKSTMRFVPSNIIQELHARDIKEMSLGRSIKRPYSILVFDLRAFSINSEIMSAKDIFDFINNFFSISGPIVRSHNGFIEEYLGDAAVALFAAPRDSIKAGIEIYKSIVLDEATRLQVGGDAVNIGLGIKSAAVTMGIIGDEMRLASTIISRGIDDASALEELTKKFHSGLLVSSSTLKRVPKHERDFSYRYLGKIYDKNTNRTYSVYEVLDALHTAAMEKRIRTKKIFHEGVRSFLKKDYERALAAFNKTFEEDDKDMCTILYLKNTKRCMKDPERRAVLVV